MLSVGIDVPNDLLSEPPAGEPAAGASRCEPRHASGATKPRWIRVLQRTAGGGHRLACCRRSLPSSGVWTATTVIRAEVDASLEVES